MNNDHSTPLPENSTRFNNENLRFAQKQDAFVEM
jgi:hypothetical protein